MPYFEYKAISSAGSSDTGVIEASSRPDALSKVRQLGLKPVRIDEVSGPRAGKGKGGAAPAFKFPWGGKKITFAMLENFTRLLSSLLTAGVPLSKALTVLHKETSAPAAQKQWRQLHDLVVDGLALSDAMSRFPQTFPSVYTAMVEAGETGGFLDLVLGQIADFQARDKDLKGKVMTAMIYPAVLFVLAVAAVVFLMLFFIPKFKTLFDDFQASLPLITKVVVGTSEFLMQYGLYVLAGLVGVVVLVKKWMGTDAGKRRFEEVILKAPVVGPLMSKFALARFCRMLGTLINAGVPLVNGLTVARRSLGNQTLTDATSESIERVKKGESLAKSLSSCKSLFSGATIEMISIAEESGRLDKELMRLAEVTEKDLDQQLKMAVALMEPMMLFMAAGFIGTIFVGMVIPIFTIQDYIK